MWRVHDIASRFAGVTIVEAMKQVYAFSSGKRARRLMPRFRPALLPSPQACANTKLGNEGFTAGRKRLKQT